MILTIANGGRPAIAKEDGTILFHSMYMGNRYWGDMYNVLKDYNGKTWSIRECSLAEIAEEGKDFSILNQPRCFIAECENGRLLAALDDHNALLKTEVKNEGNIGGAGADKDPLHVIALGGMHAERLGRAMYNGFTTYNGLNQMDMNARVDVKIFAENEYCESAVHMPMIDKTGKAYHFGFVSFEQYFTSIFACEGGTMEYRLFMDGRKIQPDSTIVSDWMLFTPMEDTVSELPDYTRFIRDFNRFQKPARELPVGFSSWYYYMDNINERMVYENLEAIDKMKDRVPFKVFQIDAGWGPGNHQGEAHADRFPKGMKFYADLIREHGLIPGLWLNPFRFDPGDAILEEHPDWFVKNDAGEDMTHGGAHMLDVTHPEAKQYVRDLYHKLTYDWGYRYLKIDMVSDFIAAGHHHDPSAGALQNVREYFRLVREASHPDTYILACTSPIFEISEFVDGIRTAVDIFERWESLVKMFNRVLKRYYINENLCIADPDCLMIRKKENEDDDCRRYCSRNDDEIRTFLTAMYATGGALLISDKLPLMSEEQIGLYEKLFPLPGRTAKPLDLMDSYIPGLLDLGYRDDVRTIAFINWGERERAFTVEIGDAHEATEHWTDEKLGEVSGSYTVTLKPHCSTLIHFKKK
ncbi:MAG: alpha-galactosidase [Clostridiales bacterium]|nr:alpha-galactosidase [Clostridiales bacterium]